MTKSYPSAKELRERERQAREKLARKQLEASTFGIRESLVEQLEKKAEDVTHEVRVKTEPQSQTLKKEIARRLLAKKSLLPFVLRTTPGYLPGWVHMDICLRLEKFMQDVADKKSPRLILQLPPRSGKSELASIKFPAWALGHHPQWDIIATSYAASLAEGFSRKARDLLSANEYTTVFDTRLDPDAKSVQSWRTTKAGTYNAAGVGGGIVGKGAHMLIIDDPFANKESAWSESNRDAVWDWYTTAAYTRLAPGGGVLVIMQRWHEDDLAGRLIKRMNEDPDADQFEVVHYPAIAEEDEAYRKKGDALHPERYDLEKLMQIKRNMSQADWEALYQQNPTMADGDYFTADMFHTYKKSTRPPVESMAVYQAWDLAIGLKERNDFSVGVTVGVDENDNHYVLSVRRGRWNSLELVNQIIDFADTYKPRVVGIETSQIEMTMGPILHKVMRERKKFFAIQRLKPGRRDKVMRARSLQGRMQQGMVSFDEGASWFQSLKNEMLSFPAGKNDDQVDALAYIYLMLESMTTPYVPTPRPKKSWRDKIPTLTKTRSTGSAMTA